MYCPIYWCRIGSIDCWNLNCVDFYNLKEPNRLTCLRRPCQINGKACEACSPQTGQHIISLTTLDYLFYFLIKNFSWYRGCLFSAKSELEKSCLIHWKCKHQSEMLSVAINQRCSLFLSGNVLHLGALVLLFFTSCSLLSVMTSDVLKAVNDHFV